MPPVSTGKTFQALKDALPAALILLLSFAATGALWQNERSRDKEQGQAQFEQISRVLQDNIVTTLDTYAQMARGAAGHFRANGEVSRDQWTRYIQSLDLEGNFSGLHGISFNPVLASTAERLALVEEVRANDRPDFDLRPKRDHGFYVPILYIEPMTPSNIGAIGFDIYSETLRREAIVRAIATGQPNLTAKIRLVQEDVQGGGSKEQAGALLLLPIFDPTLPATTPKERQAAITGFIVSVLRMGDMISKVFDRRDRDLRRLMHVGLIDTLSPDEDPLLFASDQLPEHAKTAQHRTTSTFEVFGRYWRLSTYSTQKYDARTASNAARAILIAGVMLSLLLTALAWVQTRRVIEARRTTLELETNQDHIQLLMREVNHRSKNLLGLVQAIARQTATPEAKGFVKQFLHRVTALAANQDLLVRNNWMGISMSDLVQSQLAHVGSLAGERIHSEGPDFQLTAAAAQSLGLALHELATNAAKYGSLSNKKGQVHVRWGFYGPVEAPRLRVTWKESGGPKVTAPKAQGFGTTVLVAMAKQTLQAEVDMRFGASGLTWQVNCPSAAVVVGLGSTP